MNHTDESARAVIADLEATHKVISEYLSFLEGLSVEARKYLDWQGEVIRAERMSLDLLLAISHWAGEPINYGPAN